MIGKKEKQVLLESGELSNLPIIAQLARKPLKILKYLLFTRLAYLMQLPIRWQTKIFTGDVISGVIPDPVFSFIYLYGFSELEITHILLRYLKKDFVFIDIGAHIGYESLIASKLVGKRGEVYSFEPTPSTFTILASNMAPFENVYCQRYAVWSKSGEIELNDYGQFYASCNSYTKARLPEEVLQRQKPKKIAVKTVSIDDYCKFNKIVPNFVKIDAESAEYKILQGMKKVLKKDKPAVLIEIGDCDGMNNTKSCIKLMKKYGYSAYDIAGGKIRRHSERGSYLNVYDNVLFLPE